MQRVSSSLPVSELSTIEELLTKNGDENLSEHSQSQTIRQPSKAIL